MLRKIFAFSVLLSATQFMTGHSAPSPVITNTFNLSLSVNAGAAAIYLSSSSMNFASGGLSAGMLASPVVAPTPLVMTSYLAGSGLGKTPTGQSITLTQNASSTASFALIGAGTGMTINYTILSNASPAGVIGSTQIAPTGTGNLVSEASSLNDESIRTLTFTIPSGQMLVQDSYSSVLTFTQGTPH